MGEDADRVGLVVVLRLHAELTAAFLRQILERCALGPTLLTADEIDPPCRRLDTPHDPAAPFLAKAFGHRGKAGQPDTAVDHGVSLMLFRPQRLSAADQLDRHAPGPV